MFFWMRLVALACFTSFLMVEAGALSRALKDRQANSKNLAININIGVPVCNATLVCPQICPGLCGKLPIELWDKKR